MSIPEGDNSIVERAQMGEESDVAGKCRRPRPRIYLGALVLGGMGLVLSMHLVYDVAGNCRSESDVEAMKKLETQVDFTG